MTPEQFADVAQLLRMRPGSARYRAAELHFTLGLPVPDAARAAGADYVHAWKVVRTINLELARMRRILSTPPGQ